MRQKRSNRIIMMNLKAVFVDIDNTLLSFDEYVRQTMKSGFEHFGLKPYEPYMYDIFEKENNALWQKIEQGTLTFPELQKVRWNLVFEKLEISFDGPVFEKYFRKALHESAIEEPGAREMLAYLKSKYILCVASNGPYEQQVHRLELADMRKYFDYVFVSEKIGVSKPAREFFETAFEQLNENRTEKISSAETMIIGDSLTSDMAGGLQYGMKTCYYRRNSERAMPDQKMGRIDFVIDHLDQVADYI